LGHVVDELTPGGTVKGDPVKEIVKAALDHGIDFIDTAKVVSKPTRRFAGMISRGLGAGFGSGKSEVEMPAGFEKDATVLLTYGHQRPSQ
jgi:hypothetical protein